MRTEACDKTHCCASLHDARHTICTTTPRSSSVRLAAAGSPPAQQVKLRFENATFAGAQLQQSLPLAERQNACETSINHDASRVHPHEFRSTAHPEQRAQEGVAGADDKAEKVRHRPVARKHPLNAPLLDDSSYHLLDTTHGAGQNDPSSRQWKSTVLVELQLCQASEPALSKANLVTSVAAAVAAARPSIWRSLFVCSLLPAHLVPQVGGAGHVAGVARGHHQHILRRVWRLEVRVHHHAGLQSFTFGM